MFPAPKICWDLWDNSIFDFKVSVTKKAVLKKFGEKSNTGSLEQNQHCKVSVCEKKRGEFQSSKLNSVGFFETNSLMFKFLLTKKVAFKTRDSILVGYGNKAGCFKVYDQNACFQTSQTSFARIFESNSWILNYLLQSKVPFNTCSDRLQGAKSFSLKFLFRKRFSKLGLKFCKLSQT